jgi:hypothetical protein
MISNFADGQFGARALPIMELNGKLLYSVELYGGTVLFTSDGTEVGTHRIMNSPFAFINLNGWFDLATAKSQIAKHSDGKAYFLGVGEDYHDGLYSSDGTPEGTVFEAFPETCGYGGGFIASSGPKLLFTAGYRSPSNNCVRALYVSDGTMAGSTPLFLPTLTDFYPYNPPILYPDGSGGVYFKWYESNRSVSSLFYYDGTTENTLVLMSEIQSFQPQGMLGSNLVSVMVDPSVWQSKIFVTNGSQPVTGPSFAYQCSQTGALTASLNGRFFTDCGGNGFISFTPDTGSALNLMPFSGRSTSTVTTASGVYFGFDGWGPNARGMWHTDGTLEGTSKITLSSITKSIPGMAVTLLPQVYDSDHGLLYFTADDGGNGEQLWVMPAP